MTRQREKTRRHNKLQIQIYTKSVNRNILKMIISEEKLPKFYLNYIYSLIICINIFHLSYYYKSVDYHYHLNPLKLKYVYIKFLNIILFND